MQFTESDLEQACEDLGTIPYFPKESRASVMRLLASMCPHREALRWLVSETMNRVREWPGPAELRGLLCTRYDPADGVDQPSCNIPGYTPDEQEAKFITQHNELKALPVTPTSFSEFLEHCPVAVMPSTKAPPKETQRASFKPLSPSEIATLEAEATDERLSAEARDRARSLLARLAVGAKT